MVLVSPRLGKPVPDALHLFLGVVILPAARDSVRRAGNPAPPDVMVKRVELHVRIAGGVSNVIITKADMRR
jgi:hypothetical protein